MTERSFVPGEVIFHEGEASEGVALLLEGRVEVVKQVGIDTVLLGHIGAGEFAGEMGVIEGRHRSASVRAVTPVRAELMDRDAFFLRIAGDTALAHRTLVRLSERLHAVNERLTEMTVAQRDTNLPAVVAAPPGRATETGGEIVRLLPGSPELRGYLPENGIQIDELPFHVGRRADDVERDTSAVLGLAIDEERPYRLSRMHFTIVRQTGGLAIRDTISRLGTTVNGEEMGEQFPLSRVDLKHGENIVVAGGHSSPWVFKVVVG